MIAANLPALQVVVPLVAAPLCLLLSRRAAWALATLAGALTLVIAVRLLQQVLAGGALSYAMGGWIAPLGIEYRIDEVGAFVLVIVSAVSTLSLLFARASVEREVPADRIAQLYTGWMLLLAGLLGITVTGDAFNLFVFLEISSLATYLLVALARDRRALVAAFRYLVMGTIGATFLLIGIGLLYMVTGTLNMSDIAERLPAMLDTRTAKVAFAFVLVGLGIKAAIFPLHLWLPSAYAYAPSAVSAVIAGTATKVAVYALLRLVFSVFGTDFAFGRLDTDAVLMLIALPGIFVASTVAIFQQDVKRMLAWSSIAQVGYMVLGLALLTHTALTATIIHLFNHAVMKTALFMALGAVFFRAGSVQLDRMAGLGRRMPLTMAAFVIAGLGLVGVPLTVGFVSKWYLVVGALEAGHAAVAVAVLVSSLLALVYVWRVVEVAYLREPDEGAAAVREAPLAMLAPMWLLVLASLYFGVDTAVTTEVAARAATVLLRGPL